MRPFSLIVALATCGLGVLLAAGDGAASALVAAAVILAGLLLQIGVNLVNDHADLALVDDETERQAIRRNARAGAAAIVLACAVGLWLVAQRGWPLLCIGTVGVLGLWGYAAEPINLKARGLGLPAVFLLTGVLMVSGAYVAMTGTLSMAVLAWSVPFSLFAMLLLLGNELRDVEADVADGHGTFTVRFGLARGARLYRVVVVLVALATLMLATAYDAPLLGLAVPALLALPWRHLEGSPAQRRGLARMTGRGYALYSLLFLVTLWATRA